MIEVNIFYLDQNKVFVSNEEKERGNFYDRNNISLTANIKLSNISIHPKEIYNKPKFLKKIITLFPDLSREDKYKKLSELSKKIDTGDFFWFLHNVDTNELQKIVNLGETGIQYHDTFRRAYIHRELFSHLIGKVDLDNKGISGMEKSFNAVLSDGDETKFISSLDVRLQHIVRDELLDAIQLYRSIGGSGLIIDINNGEILSMVSLPDFDPNLNNKITKKMFNRNTLGNYEFGSVMKTFTTAIGIEENKFSLDTFYKISKSIKVGEDTVNDDHRPCDEGHCSVQDIFVNSSNVGTILMVHDIGSTLQREYLENLGLLNKLYVNLPELAAPLIPDPWMMVNTESISYGYGLSISPLHLAYATATVLNGGYLLQPSLKKKVTEKDYGRQIFSTKTSEIMKYLFSKVVTEGTAERAFKMNTEYEYIVGGKTGTAEKVQNKGYVKKKITSFISAFPINRPKFLVLISLDEPKGIDNDSHPYNTFGWTNAGWNAARVSRKIIDRISPILDTKIKYLPSDHLIINTSLQ